jgi:integrase
VSVKQTNDGKWLVQVDRKGIPRVRKSFDVKEKAEQFEREYLAKYQKGIQQNDDRRTLNELIDIWYRYHGINLSDNARFKRKMIVASNAMGNPIASQLTATQFVDYRYERMVSGKNIVTGNTFNNLHAFMSSMFNRLKRLNVIDYDNPLATVDFVRVHDRQMSYLSKDQIDTLFECIKMCMNPSVFFVVNLCLRTGSRWNEAAMLKRKQLHDGRVTYEFTKSKRVRSIPLDDQFYKLLIDFSKYKNPDDRIFTNCLSGYRSAITRAGIDLPKGQLSHVLRHSFASHFMMGNGNILTLQKILGHSDIKETLKYSHLAPNHLDDARRLNPLASNYGGKLAVNSAIKRH